MQADPERLLAEVQALVHDHGWQIRDEVRADTGSVYFSAVRPSKDAEGQDVFLRIRISNHPAAGWQARARHAFVTTHCVRRARRDLDRLKARLIALDEDDPRGRASRPKPLPPS